MKVKNKINQIRQEMMSETPDINRRKILQNAKIPSLPYQQSTKSYRFKFLKPAFASFVVVLFVGIIFSFVVILKLGMNNYDRGNDADDDQSNIPEERYDQNLVDSHIDKIMIANSSISILVAHDDFENIQTIDEQHLNFINRYLYLSEIYLSPITFREINTIQSYPYGLQVEFNDFLDNNIIDIYYHIYGDEDDIIVSSKIIYEDIVIYTEGYILVEGSNVEVITTYQDDNHLIKVTVDSDKEHYIEILENNILIESANLVIDENLENVYFTINNEAYYTVTKSNNINNDINIEYQHEDQSDSENINIDIDDDYYIIISNDDKPHYSWAR